MQIRSFVCQQELAELQGGAGAPFRPVIGDAGEGLLAHLVQTDVLAPDGVANVRHESLAILGDCNPPFGQATSRTLLVCGYVQSGKTVSIETVTALAKDNGYRIFILIAGVTTNLVDQSSGRLEEHLRAVGGYDWVTLENPRADSQRQIDALVQQWRRHGPGGADCQVLFITVMKNVLHLRPLAAVLRDARLVGIPALIFDDEADQASMNTRPNAPLPSPVYEAILELRASVPHHTFLQYTATPQAPLLISRVDSLSADYGELVSPGDGYVGGLEFFRRRPGLVNTIPGTQIFDHRNIPSDPPDSLIEALQIFFVGVAAKYVQSRILTQHRSMLIHPHQRTVVHNAYLAWVQNLQRDWAATIASQQDPDRPELLREFRAAHAELARTVADLPDFDAIVERLSGAIERTVVTLVNSTNGEEINWRNGYAHILVGGEKLSRGYTVKGLTVTYMPRGPGGWTADTIQQRARFFGYHARPNNNYVDYCRVYLHNAVRQAYTDYIDHEETMREQIANFRGRPLRELKRAFFLDGRLRATRHNIMRQLYQRPNLRAWFEQRVPTAAPNNGARNLTLVNELAARLNLIEDEFQRHYYADAALADILENFLVPYSSPDERDEVPLTGARLLMARIIEEDEGASCRVVFMDQRKQPRERTIAGGTINLQQGRSSSDDPNRYPGDRDIRANARDRVTVQIHILHVVEDVPTSEQPPARRTIVEAVPALAIYIPLALARDVIVQPNN